MNKVIPIDEQETIICFSPARVSKDAEIYSCMPNVINSIRKHAKDRPETVRILKDEGDAVFAAIDRSCVKFAPKRKMTDEQRKAAAQRLAEGRAKRK